MLASSFNLAATWALLGLLPLPAVLAQQPSCQNSPISPNQFKDGTDYFANQESRVSLKYAKNFDVTYNKHYKEVTVRNNGQSNKFTLTLCNAPGNSPTIFVPVVKVGFTATDLIDMAYVERLGQRASILYTGAPSQNLTSACLQTLMEEGQPKPFPSNGSVADASLGVVFGQPAGVQATAQFLAVADAIRQEASPLARGEWIKFFALFYNSEKEANKLWSNITAQYECQTERAKAKGYKTRVAWTTYKDGTATLTDYDADYAAQLIADLGGSHVRVSSVQDLRGADMLIDGTPVGPGYDITAFKARYTGVDSSFPFMRAGLFSKVFRTDGLTSALGIDDFPLSSFAQPEVVLADIINDIDDAFLPGYAGTWLKSLAASGAATNHVPTCMDKTSIPGPNISLCPPMPAQTAKGGEAFDPVVVASVLGSALVVAGIIFFIYRKEIIIYLRRRRIARSHANEPTDTIRWPGSLEAGKRGGAQEIGLKPLGNL
ncbi:hypothetical protein HK104_007053 [Borealophlyctis nickersoniae]|nr:hypothetical protein HK104_007053 [Borealophlyctis nickersoniae]